MVKAHSPCIFLICTLILAVCVPLFASSYTISDLGMFSVSGLYTIQNMNGRGQVVGTLFNTINHAYVYTPGSGVKDIGTLPGDYFATAYAINDLGQVVGVSSGNRGDRMFLYAADTGMTVMNLGLSVAQMFDMNNAGQIVGVDARNHGFLYTPGSGSIDLGVGRATAISEGGWAVVESQSLYIPGTGIADLGITLGHLAATGVNDSGQIALTDGYSSSVYDWRTHSTSSLCTLGGQYAMAYCIDNSGRVVGLSKDANGVAHAVAWTPVPEPSSLLAVLAGLGAPGAAMVRRRRRDPACCAKVS